MADLAEILLLNERLKQVSLVLADLGHLGERVVPRGEQALDGSLVVHCEVPLERAIVIDVIGYGYLLLLGCLHEDVAVVIGGAGQQLVTGHLPVLLEDRLEVIRIEHLIISRIARDRVRHVLIVEVHGRYCFHCTS
jgi:hypothetical protein